MQKAVDSLTSERKNLLSGTDNDDVRIPGRANRNLAVDGDLEEVQLRIKQVRVAKQNQPTKVIRGGTREGSGSEARA